MKVSLFILGIGLNLVLSPVVQAGSTFPMTIQVADVGPNEHRIQIHTETKVLPQKLWNALTDYDHHSYYIPHMLSVRTVKRDGASVVIEQIGAIRVLFWNYRMRAVFQIQEQAPHAIIFKAIDGDFSKLEGRWDVQEGISRTTQLDVTFICHPKARVPSLAVRFAVKRYLVQMVGAIVAHAEKQ